MNSPVPFWETIRLTVLQATFTPTEPAHLPGFKGSTFRGALGHALQHLSCVNDSGRCDGCMAPESCAYGLLFESQTSSTTKGDNSVVGYVFAPPLSQERQFEPGDELSVGLTLIGSARLSLPWCVWGLARLGQEGLGTARTPWQLLDVSAQDNRGAWQPLFGSVERCPEILPGALSKLCPPRTECALEFLTPAVLGIDEEQPLNGELIVRRLVRRVKELATVFCGWNAPGYQVAPLIELARQITITASQLREKSWERFSSRQGKHHPLRGMVGTITLANIPPELWPLVLIGQWTHLGKSAAFGLGQYRLLFD